ncbi:MAG: DoxX family protein [Myxococcota bacterium]
MVSSKEEITMQTLVSYVPTAARVLLGLVFTVFGLNGFFNFLPQPPMPEAAGAFLGALAATGYMFPLIKGTELVAGLMLLGNRFVPLALVLLAPVIVNIVAFHAVLAPGGMALPLLVLALELTLAWSYRDAFRSLLAARTSPAVTARRREGTSVAAPQGA